MKFSRLALVAVICLFSADRAPAAKVILKDGKTYEGRIIAETDGDVLIKTNPVDRPKLIPNDMILTVLRDPVPPVVEDPQRYFAVGARLLGDVHDSQHIELEPAASLALDASLRFHPLVELGANLDWTPTEAGHLEVSDGVNDRTYESFYAYGGTLWSRIYPFFFKHWSYEPFLVFGYRWSQLVPKGSGDDLSGGGMVGGLGVQWPVRKKLYVQAGFLYQHASYGSIDYLNREGSLEPHIRSDSFSLFTGLSWRVL